jgi:hypothetical protein
MKEDGCGKTENKGERIDEEDGIFPFEGEDKEERVWIILEEDCRFFFAQPMDQKESTQLIGRKSGVRGALSAHPLWRCGIG